MTNHSELIYLMVVINGERSALKSNQFRDRFMKTRKGELQLMVEKYRERKEKKKEEKSAESS